MVQQNQLSNPEMQKEISAVIEKNPTLKGKITQLPNSECDCENDETTGLWKFPVICMGLYFIFWFFMGIYLFSRLTLDLAWEFAQMLNQIANKLDCFWAPY